MQLGDMQSLLEVGIAINLAAFFSTQFKVAARRRTNDHRAFKIFMNRRYVPELQKEYGDKSLSDIKY
jgi:hypothetical protein